PQAAELARLDAGIKAAQDDYETPRETLAAGWDRAARAALVAEGHWTVLVPDSLASEAGAALVADKDAVISAEKDPKDGKDTFRVTVKTNLSGVVAFRLEALSADGLPGQGPGRGADGNFVITEIRVEDAASNSIPLVGASATFEAPGFPAAAAA